MRILPGPDHVHHRGDVLDGRARELVQRRLDRVLDLGVERGADEISALVDLFAGQPGFGQVLQRVLAEEPPVARGDAPARQGLRLGQDAERLLLRGTDLGGALGDVLDHRVEHDVAPRQHAVRIGVRVQRGTGLHHAGEHRGLGDVQVLRVDAEVRLRGVLHAEGSVPERHEVQVAGEDLVLGQLVVERQRHPDLPDLARGRRLDRGAAFGVGLGDHVQQVVLHVLLVDRGRALLDLPAGGVGEEGADGALPVDTLVFGEALVLDGDDGELHLVGDLVARHLEPALVVEPGDGCARGVGHGGDRGHHPLDEFGGTVVHRVRGAVRDVAEPPRPPGTSHRPAGLRPVPCILRASPPFFRSTRLHSTCRGGARTPPHAFPCPRCAGENPPTCSDARAYQKSVSPPCARGTLYLD